MVKYIIAAITALFATSCYCSSKVMAATFTADPKRSVYIIGQIGGEALSTAATIEHMSQTSDEPIDIIINSPGGSIYAGMQILSSMKVAQARQVTIRCFVPVLAASMAFAIFAQCDERYALDYTLLLWHPGKVSSQQPMTEDTLHYQGNQLKVIEKELNEIEYKALGVSREFFLYHYLHETLWFAKSLNTVAPSFLDAIVDNYENVKSPYNVGE